MQVRRLMLRMKQYATEFTESERAIAEYLARNGTKAAFTAAALLSREIGVSEATLIRFSRTIGYGNYTELQKDVQAEIEERLNLRPSNRLAGMTRNVSAHWDALEQVVAKDIENLRLTLSYCSADEFTQAVDLVLQSQHVFVVGMRAAAPIASYLAYSLNLVMPGVHDLGYRNDDQVDRLFSSSNSDVLVVIGIARQTKSLLDVVRYAKSRGVKIIAITDGPTAPLALEADVALTVESESPALLLSHTPLICMTQALVTAVGAARGESTRERVHEVERVLDEYLFADR